MTVELSFMEGDAKQDVLNVCACVREAWCLCIAGQPVWMCAWNENRCNLSEEFSVG